MISKNCFFELEHEFMSVVDNIQTEKGTPTGFENIFFDFFFVRYVVQQWLCDLDIKKSLYNFFHFVIVRSSKKSLIFFCRRYELLFPRVTFFV